MKQNQQNRRPGAASAIIGALALMLTAGLFALTGCEVADGPMDPETPADRSPGVEEDIPTPGRSDRQLFIHCGNSMRPAAEALAAEFESRYDIGVRLNFGGSADLLSSIELGQRGDLYLPHDPYAEMLDEKGLLEYYEVVGHIEPIIIVPKGNPGGIETMADLAARDLKVAVPDARYATAGQLIVEAFEEMGLLDEFQANVAMEARGHNEVAMALVSGHVDAAMVWSFIATSYKDRVDMIIPPDADFPEKRVTLCLLTHAQDRDAAEKFMELATSEAGQAIFEELGYKLDRGE